MDSGSSRDDGASWGGTQAGTRPPTRASPRPTGTTRPSTPAAGHSTPRSPPCRILPSTPNRLRTRTSPGLTTATRKPGPPTEPADRGFAWLDRAEGNLAVPTKAEPAPEPAVERMPRHQADGLTSPERTDFWAKPASSASAAASTPADLQLPAPAPRAEEPVIARASWPAAADTATTPAAEPAQRPANGAAPGTASAAATAAQPLSSAGSARSAGSAAQTAVSERGDRRQDRFFSVRLLAIIVIAALIGSALVLLLK